MRTRSFTAILSTLALLVGATAASAAVDKVIFRDPALPLSWQNASVADDMNTYFTGKGYTSVDAAGLKAFMTKHVADLATSVVVMANDVVPDSIMNSTNAGANQNPNSLLNNYLWTGGKVIYIADWPAYYVVLDDLTKPTWNDVGAAAAFGFYPAKWGFDGAGAITFTDLGKQWGLTKPWVSARADDPAEVDLILGTTATKGGVMPWVKQYTNRPGSGFTYLYDFPHAAGDLGPDDMAQIQRVAEYFPSGEFKLSTEITGVLNGSDGKPIAGAYVKITGGPNNVKRSALTDDKGAFFVYVDPGNYAVGASGTAPSDLSAAHVTVAKDQVAKVTLSKSAFLDLSTAGGQKWEIQVPALKSSEDPNQVAADPATAFQEYTVPMDWTTDLLTNAAGNNTYAWYRTKVAVPASYVGQDVVLAGFNVDDIDYTYWNGQLIGSTNVWSTKRVYAIPGSLVKASNDLVILNFNGTGGAGISQTAPTLSLVHQGGGITGKVVDQNGKGLSGVSVTATAQGVGGAFGAQVGSTLTDLNGNYAAYGLGAGGYVVHIGGLPIGASQPADSAALTLAAGASQVYNFTVNVPIPITQMSLRAADLKAGQGWHMLSEINVYMDAAGAATEKALVEANAAKYGDPKYVDTGADSILKSAAGTEMWVTDWQYVPGDAGPDGRAGTPGGIPDNTDWVQRVHFTLSGDMDKGDRYEFTGFNVDDVLFAAYINGVQVMGQPSAGCCNEQTLILPASAINHGGKDNVLTLIGQEGGGGAGTTNDYGAGTPSLIALQPVTGGTTGGLKLGDPLNLGKIGIGDATFVLQVVVKLKTPTADQTTASDVDKDGVVTIKDVTKILQAIVNNTGF